MTTPLPEAERFSLVRRAQSFTHAWRGMGIFFRSTHNAWMQLVLMGAVLVLGFFFHITRIEWVVIIFACGFVLVAEAFNTAIETDINLTSPDYHPYAKDTKDIAAGAVLLAALTASVIGGIVFVPYLVHVIPSF